ncbi:hypothetical protein J6590_077056 [Homalodisca vitripennis]|nr:hypothetical protein J6590_077056 [Homalodisca vitripennis]
MITIFTLIVGRVRKSAAASLPIVGNSGNDVEPPSSFSPSETFTPQFSNLPKTDEVTNRGFLSLKQWKR